MRQKLRLTLAIGVVGAALAVGIPAVALGTGGMRTAAQDTSPVPAVGPVTSSQATGVDPATETMLRTLNEQGVGAAVLGKRLLDGARTLSTTIDGKHLYLVPTETGKVCLDLEDSSEGWFDPVSQANPVLLAAEDDDGPGGVGPTVYGVAMDGVRSVTFTAGGDRHVVPVTQNVFVFHGDAKMSVESVTAISATFSDGTEQLLR